MILALPPIAAEPILHIGTFPVTNAYINSTLALLIFLIIGYILKSRTALRPKGIQNFAEAMIEFFLVYVDQVTRDRKKSMQFLPIVGGLFFFILISNWMGLIPGTGSIGRWLMVHGERELVPLFRPANSDLNMTLAMALLAVISSHVLGIVAIGFLPYTNKFIKLGDIFHSFRKGGTSIFVAFVEFGVGIIEIFSEVSKMVSLSLRLFGNVFAGEVLLTVIAGLVAYAIPLPFIFLEILVGLIQAMVFSMLTLVYLMVATMPLHDAGHGEHGNKVHKDHVEPVPTV